jgi:hypothetical protein
VTLNGPAPQGWLASRLPTLPAFLHRRHDGQRHDVQKRRVGLGQLVEIQ